MLLRAADEGDPVALTLVNRQADEISVMAITAMRRLDPTGLATPGHLWRRRRQGAEPTHDVRHHQAACRAAPRAQVRVIEVRRWSAPRCSAWTT